jgi:hypothetical protein
MANWALAIDHSRAGMAPFFFRSLQDEKQQFHRRFIGR